MVAAKADRIDLKKVFTSNFLSPWKAAFSVAPHLQAVDLKGLLNSRDRKVSVFQKTDLKI
jgi:hypothetical protein